MKSVGGVAIIGLIMLVVLGAVLGGFFLIGPMLSSGPKTPPADGAAAAIAPEEAEAASALPTAAPTVARISLVPTSLTVREPDGSASFRLSLSSEPAAPVLIPLTASNDQCRVSPELVTVDRETWLTGVEVTVTAVDDAAAEGTQTCEIRLSAASSVGSDYNGKVAGLVSVTVVDDESAAIAVSPPGLELSEPDGSGTFVVKLEVRSDLRGVKANWVVTSGTGNYVNLHGVGKLIGIYFEDESGILDKYTGKVNSD